ncbi:MAG: GNAT family N-acetyltransferase [Thermosulfidibacteraceae bacterium]|jgi:L-amino acid N-acyltransferase YncA
MIQKNIILLDGRKATIRLLSSDDTERLYNYFCVGISEEDFLLFKDNVKDYFVIKGWVENVDLDRVVPIVGVDDLTEEIIATGTLHTRGHGWFRYLGKIRVSVCLRCRGIGLGKAMIETLLEIARERRLRAVIAEVLSVQSIALKVFKEVGFVEVGKIDSIAKDLKMNPMDLHILVYYLD